MIRLIPFEGTDAGTIIADAKAATRSRCRPADVQPVAVPADVIGRIRRMCVDPEALAERYKAKTRGRRIADPSAYLMRIAQNEVAKRDGVSVETVAKLAAADNSERAVILAKAAGVDVDPAKSERRHARARRSPTVARYWRHCPTWRSRGAPTSERALWQTRRGRSSVRRRA